MVIGMVLAGLSFVIAGFIELKVQSSQQKLNSGESKLFLFNGAETSFSYELKYNGSEIANNSLIIGQVRKHACFCCNCIGIYLEHSSSY